jgi:hypothetical protein
MCCDGLLVQGLRLFQLLKVQRVQRITARGGTVGAVAEDFGTSPQQDGPPQTASWRVLNCLVGCLRCTLGYANQLVERW